MWPRPPVKLSEYQEELLRQFQDSLSGSNSHSPKKSNFFDDAKGFFEEMKP